MPRSPAGCPGQATSFGSQGIRRVFQPSAATPGDWAGDSRGDRAASQPGRGEEGSSRFPSSMDCTTTAGALCEGGDPEQPRRGFRLAQGSLALGYFFGSLVSSGGVASSSLKPLRNSRKPRPNSPATLPIRPAPKSRMTINRMIPSSSGPRRMGKGPPYMSLAVRASARAQAIRKGVGLKLARRTKTMPR